ncbi:unnamed protein product [Echinostoma caproni]|uniref:DUF5641 domain-containing protein n=1 Tax=Echinostoma caproni TaxID=27848 RepID=A0A183B5P3_9TREM|nr:unnamed protein product [Echinostoma caproni]
MTDEKLLTFFAEVEKIVNNRPLTPISDDVKDLEVITPNKLLLLGNNETVIDHLEFPQVCIRLWRRVQASVDTFWKRWKSEYLASLQERHKWQGEGRDLKVGDLVLVTTEGVQINCWPLGVVNEVLPTKDGLIREVLVRKAHGTLRRDVRNLCWLEGDDG